MGFSPPIQNIEKMKSFHLITCCISLIVVGCGCGKKSGNTQDWTFHTTPDKWEKPRVYHIPYDNEKVDRISIERIFETELEYEKTFSPNDAYWFSIIEPIYIKTKKLRSLQINIYNERDYLLRLNLSDIYQNYARDIKWVNEKILYIRAWGGRVGGIDLLFDVESEKIIYKENIVDGGFAYSQWPHAKTEK